MCIRDRDKDVMKKLIFAIPVFILFVGIVAYFIVVPKDYSRVISFFDWLFTCLLYTSHQQQVGNLGKSGRH